MNLYGVSLVVEDNEIQTEPRDLFTLFMNDRLKCRPFSAPPKQTRSVTVYNIYGCTAVISIDMLFHLDGLF